MELTKKQKEKYLKQLQKQLYNGDTEEAHEEADDILINILRDIGEFDEIIEAYTKINKWYA